MANHGLSLSVLLQEWNFNRPSTEFQPITHDRTKIAQRFNTSQESTITSELIWHNEWARLGMVSANPFQP